MRDAREGEKLTTLDDVERTLGPRDLVIADAAHALGLAGLMGGLESEVRDSTHAIILESANFNGARVRRMSAALALRTEASSRHEKSLAPILTDIGAARAAQLLVAVGADAYAPQVTGTPLVAAPPIELPVREVARLLGLELSSEQMRGTFSFWVARYAQTARCSTSCRRLGGAISQSLPISSKRSHGWKATTRLKPSSRRFPRTRFQARSTIFEERVATSLEGLGYHEIVTYALQGTTVMNNVARSGLRPSHSIVRVLNPLTEEQRVLRWALGPGIFEYLAKVDRPYRVFEIGHVFSLDDGVIHEEPSLAFGFTVEPIDEPAWRDANFLRLKGDCEALLRAVAGIEVETTPTSAAAIIRARAPLRCGKAAKSRRSARSIRA